MSKSSIKPHGIRLETTIMRCEMLFSFIKWHSLMLLCSVWWLHANRLFEKMAGHKHWAHQINANDILFVFRVCNSAGLVCCSSLFHSKWLYIFFCVEKKLAGFLLSFHELTFVQLFAFLYLSHKHNIIRSINAWYYYDGRSFCRLFVW